VCSRSAPRRRGLNFGAKLQEAEPYAHVLTPHSRVRSDGLRLRVHTTHKSLSSGLVLSYCSHTACNMHPSSWAWPSTLVRPTIRCRNSGSRVQCRRVCRGMLRVLSHRATMLLSCCVAQLYYCMAGTHREVVRVDRVSSRTARTMHLRTGRTSGGLCALRRTPAHTTGQSQARARGRLRLPRAHTLQPSRITLLARR
jgi:hypothetical protein